MAKKSIEVLFQKEEYDKAITTIKQMLKEDTDNGELIYYLFLAENKDYANINLNNIVNEVNFNRALDLSNRRLRNEFEAEYNFFRDSDPSFRKMFCYARRENKDKVLELFERTNGPVTLPNDLDAYLDNMDYIVTSRVTKKTLELNLLVVNLLFILTREKRLVSIMDEIRNILVEIDSRYKEFKGINDKVELADFIFNPKSEDDKIELVEVKEEPKKEEPNDNEIVDAISAFNNNRYTDAYIVFKKHLDDFESKYYYGLCNLKGLGTTKNESLGIEKITEVAEEGLPLAQNKMGELIERGIVKGEKEDAFLWYNTAAQNGNLDAIYNTGRCYETGFGCKGNISKAFEWYEKGAFLNSESCILKMATYYEKNGDYPHAVLFYLKIDKIPDAAYRLAYFYYNGVCVTRDKVKGRKYLEYAALRGHHDAMKQLGKVEPVEIKEAPKKKKSKSKLMRYFSNDETDDEIELYNKKMNPITKVFIVILWFVAIFMVLIAMVYFIIGH